MVSFPQRLFAKQPFLTKCSPVPEVSTVPNVSVVHELALVLSQHSAEPASSEGRDSPALDSDCKAVFILPACEVTEVSLPQVESQIPSPPHGNPFGLIP